MTITFHKGMGTRRTSSHQETVDLLSAEQLRAIVGVVLADPEPDSREMLRSIPMAGCSPRVFWSLVRLYGGDVQRGLRLLLPNKDWTWLESRKRTLSEKALENERQKKEGENRRASDADDINSTRVRGPQDDAAVQSRASSCSLYLDSLVTDLKGLTLEELWQDKDFPSELRTAVCPVKLQLLFCGSRVSGSTSEDGGPVLRMACLDLETWRSKLDLARTARVTGADEREEGGGNAAAVADLLTLARRRVVSRVWTRLCDDLVSSVPGLSTGEVMEALCALGIAGIVQAAPWRLAPETLVAESALLGRIPLDGWRRMLDTCEEVLQWCPALVEAVGEDEGDMGEHEEEGEDEDEDETEEQERVRLRKESWVLHDESSGEASPFPYAGRRVRVTVSSEEDGTGGVEVIGTLLAYLPPTDEEPQALWKAWLPDGLGRQDLEKEEVEMALA